MATPSIIRRRGEKRRVVSLFRYARFSVFRACRDLRRFGFVAPTRPERMAFGRS